MAGFDDIKLNEGKVVEEDGEQIAVYKNEKGEIIKLSAVCTHAGCIVKWNNSDKTWDCSCHDSRFTKEGKVIQGPAQKPLNEMLYIAL